MTNYTTGAVKFYKGFADSDVEYVPWKGTTDASNNAKRILKKGKFSNSSSGFFGAGVYNTLAWDIGTRD